jgi:hypothetical protein
MILSIFQHTTTLIRLATDPPSRRVRLAQGLTI